MKAASFSPLKPLFAFSSASSLNPNTRPPPPPKPTALRSLHAIVPSPPRAVAEALVAAPEAVEKFAADRGNTSSGRASPSKLDRSGRFCSPRAGRELALLISYAACLEGCDPVRLFDRRVNATREPGFVFDKACLVRYNHMSFGGAPVEVETEEEAVELTSQNERDSANEADVLSAPPKLVYNKFILRFAREILEAVASGWDQRVQAINDVIPPNWKDEPIARILELCILHIAMAEITAKGTRHQIVINEAVDLAKRFCDGGAPRIINGCLRTFVREHCYTAKSISQSAE